MTVALTAQEIVEAREKIRSIYNALMAQVVLRLDCISDSLGETRSNPLHSRNWQNAEFCYLQLRKICEYVALSVLVAHDLYKDTTTAKLKKQWHASEIFGRLLQLNPYAFPVAIKINFDYHGLGHHFVEPLAPELVSADLERIYGACGDRLHVGNLKRLIAGRIPPYDLAEVSLWCSKFVLTLNNHIVRLPHVGSVLMVTMKHEEDGMVHSTFADAEGPFVIGEDASIFNIDP